LHKIFLNVINFVYHNALYPFSANEHGVVARAAMLSDSTHYSNYCFW